MSDGIEAGAVGAEIGEVIADALESALETEAAQIDTGEAVALAFIENNRSQEIATIREGLAECQETLSLLPLLMGEQMREMMAAQSQEFLLLMATHRESVAVPLAAAPSEIAPLSAELTPAPLAIVQPEELTAPPPESEAESQRKKRNRLV